MTETTEPTATESGSRTVQSYRHEIRKLVRRVPAFRRVEEILEGRQGLTQEEQVERLDNAIEAINEGAEQVAKAGTVAVEARDYAATRDFAAHQAEKERTRQSFNPSGRTESDVSDDE